MPKKQEKQFKQFFPGQDVICLQGHPAFPELRPGDRHEVFCQIGSLIKTSEDSPFYMADRFAHISERISDGSREA